jgi:hypothetical protein
MSAPPAKPPEQSSAGPTGKAADSQLLVDQFLPRYDFAVVHADVFRVPPAECYWRTGPLPHRRGPISRSTASGYAVRPPAVVARQLTDPA